jgi:DNA-binding Lrp family transcriptional regulator
MRILTALATIGPRNLAEVARKTKISPTTLQYRLKVLSSHFSLFFLTNIYHVNLGLKKAIVLAESKPGKEELLLQCLKANTYWIYLAPIYGIIQGYLGIYTIPVNHTENFEQFLSELKNVGVAQSLQHIWTTSMKKVNLVGTWFDYTSEKWVFRWENWINEIPHESTELPYTLKDSEGFPILADELDILILKELEKNATVSFTQLARKLRVTPPAVKHRYRKLLKSKLIEGFEIHFHPFQMPFETLHFIFTFDNHEKLAKFTASLLDKPFVISLGKVLGENSLTAFFHLPVQEFKRFMEALSKLRSTQWLQDYFYIHIDLDKALRQTFPYENFKNGSWIYNHKQLIRTIRALTTKQNKKKGY